MLQAEIKTEDFAMLADILKQRSGLALSGDKTYLLQSRLTPLARKLGYGTIDELIGDVRANKSEHMLTSITEAMTTNETLFFRDGKPFDILKNFVVPYLLENRPAKTIKIWCAACSSGQEPYSIAMQMKEIGLKLKDWRLSIMGTDISNEIVDRAKTGLYSQFEVQRGLPVQHLVKYFSQEDEAWRINQELRDMVKYRTANLLEGLSFIGINDIVFCRNVLIYFDIETKAQVLERIAKQMPKDGFLFLGTAESVIGITDKFSAVPGQRGVYQKT